MACGCALQMPYKAPVGRDEVFRRSELPVTNPLTGRYKLQQKKESCSFALTSGARDLRACTNPEILASMQSAN